jgi:hypothetical protein
VLLTREEAGAIAAAMAPRIEALREQRAALVESLPPGRDDWAPIEEALMLHCRALEKIGRLSR